MTAGYPRRSVVRKLGIKEGTRVKAIGAPPNYSPGLKFVRRVNRASRSK